MKLICGTTSPEQTVSLTVFTVDIGFTVMLVVIVVPKHPFKLGVTVISVCCTSKLIFVAVKGRIFPLPLDTNPMETFACVHP